MMMSNLNKRELVFVGMLFAIAGGVWFFVFKPRNEATAMMKTEIDVRQTQIQKVDVFRSGAMDQIVANMEVIEKAIDNLHNRLPETTRSDKILHELSQMVSEHDMKAMTIRALPGGQSSDSDKAYESQDIQMELKGNFKDFYTFLQTLENTHRVIRVHNLRMKKSDVVDRPGLIQAKLHLKVYARKSPETS